MYKVKNIILVFAQSRSGHHAVIDWLFEQFNQDKLFFNFNLVEHFDPLFSNRVQYYLNDKRYYRVISQSWIESGLVKKKTQEFLLEESNNIDIIQGKDKNLLVLNYENIAVEDISVVFSKIKNCFPKANIYKVFVLRDLLNLVASKLKAGKEVALSDIAEKSKKFTEIVQVWKSYNKYILENKDCIAVVYNKWFLNSDYREDLLNKIQTDFKNNNLPNLATFGGGSSFDGYHKNKKPQDLKVLDRWRGYANNVNFMDLWYCDGVREYTNLIFGIDIYKQ